MSWFAAVVFALLATVLTVPLAGSSEGTEGGSQGPVPRIDTMVTQVTERRLAATDVSPSMVVDREDAETLYLASQEANLEECRAYASTDGGSTWTARSGPDPAPLRCQSGKIAPRWGAQTDLRQGPDGTLYFSYHASADEQENGRSVMLSRSTDGAQSWETTFIHEAAPTQGDALPELNNQPRVSIDPSDPDRLYATWTRTRAFPPADSDQPRADFEPYFAISEDGGATFGEARPVVDGLNLSFESPSPAVTDDAVHVLVTTRAPSEDDEEETPARVLNLRSMDGGETFDEHEIATAPGVGAPALVADPDGGELHAVWISNAEKNVNIYYSRSGDGVDWTEPVRLNSDPPEGFRGHYHPEISLAPDGRLDVAWYDYRHDLSPINAPPEDSDTVAVYRNFTDWASLYAIHSNDGGRTWSDDYPVTGDTLIDRTLSVWSPDFFVLAPPAVASGADDVVFAWADTRNGNEVSSAQHLFARRMTFASAQQSAASLDTSHVVFLLIGLAIGAGAALLVLAGGCAARTARPPRDAGRRSRTPSTTAMEVLGRDGQVRTARATSTSTAS